MLFFSYVNIGPAFSFFNFVRFLIKFTATSSGEGTLLFLFKSLIFLQREFPFHQYYIFFLHFVLSNLVKYLYIFSFCPLLHMTLTKI